jgi:Na+/H+ antiporter NhaD/arsenite permease-like protein
MATYQLTANSSQTALSPALTSTKVKVVSNTACYYAVGINPVAYTTGNCQLLPANTIRDINVGPGQLNYTGNTNIIGNVITGGTGPKITFITAAATLAVVNITEIGFVDFNRTTN